MTAAQRLELFDREQAALAATRVNTMGAPMDQDDEMSEATASDAGGTPVIGNSAGEMLPRRTRRSRGESLAESDAERDGQEGSDDGNDGALSGPRRRSSLTASQTRARQTRLGRSR